MPGVKEADAAGFDRNFELIVKECESHLRHWIMSKRKRKDAAAGAATVDLLSTQDETTMSSQCPSAAAAAHQSAKQQHGAKVKIADYSNFSAGQKKNSAKWQSLEHNGVTFFPRYEAHGAPLVCKGKTVKLTPQIEEVCNWWANIEGSEFAEKDLVTKNFTESFLALLGNRVPKNTKLEDFDFSLIKQHLEQQREAKNARPTEVKKLES